VGEDCPDITKSFFAGAFAGSQSPSFKSPALPPEYHISLEVNEVDEIEVFSYTLPMMPLKKSHRERIDYHQDPTLCRTP
jgi:hypothetical protein